MALDLVVLAGVYLNFVLSLVGLVKSSDCNILGCFGCHVETHDASRPPSLDQTARTEAADVQTGAVDNK